MYFNGLRYIFMKIRLGPGTIVAAAFVGPGTLVTCAIAGVKTGNSLLWVLVISVGITIFFQEMAARLVLARGQDLSNALTSHSKSKVWKFLLSALIISSVFVGNSAYQAGNLAGSVAGLREVLKIDGPSIWLPSMIVFPIGFLLAYGKYKLIERVLVFLVFLLGLSFVVTLFYLPVDYGQVLMGLIMPRLSQEDLVLMVSLVGTTVVPYNLFLHASGILEKWGPFAKLADVRTDLIISVVIGGIISMSIIVAFAAVSEGKELSITSVGDLSGAFVSTLGEKARFTFSLGVFLAGLTSSLTAPLAAAYAISSLFRTTEERGNAVFRIIWIVVLLTGLVVVLTGINPVVIIQSAQFANGLILPIIAILITIALNKEKALEYRNSTVSKVLAIGIILCMLVLGTKSIGGLLQLW
ncbi:MAG: manganese transport protein [Cyclobacteriaceae bacterium]|jgi:manganese transport protein